MPRGGSLATPTSEQDQIEFKSLVYVCYDWWNGLQWNPYIADTIGELHVGRYREPAVAEEFYKYYIYEWNPDLSFGRYIAYGRYSGVAVKRGSTVGGSLTTLQVSKIKSAWIITMYLMIDEAV